MFDNIRRLLIRAQAVAGHQGVLDSALGMAMINQVEGDYLEFGVFRGDRLIQAYETATFLTKWIRSGKDPYIKKANTSTLEAMRFIGFDSYETCTAETKRSLGIEAASIVYVDCDYYESAVPALEFVTDLLVDGSIVIFDDWFIFKGRSDRGEQRAFHEWKERHNLDLKQFIPGTAMSFMVQR